MFSYPACFGGFQRQLARHRIERRRHGHQDLLLGERRVRHLARPRPRADVPDSGGWPPPARSSRTPSGARNGSSGDGAVHARMRQPRLRRRHQPSGIFHAALLRQAPDHVIRARHPTAAPACPPGNPTRPADRGRRAADLRRALRRDSPAAEWAAVARWPARTGRHPPQSPHRRARSWWCRDRFR